MAVPELVDDVQEQQLPYSNDQDDTPAEWLPLPYDRVVSVEHPCIVKDIDRGLQSLGGEHQVKHLLAPPGQTHTIGVSLRPNDPFAKKIMSKEQAVQNLLIRVTVPRRTGRKRKRGSNDPFVADGPAPEASETQNQNTVAQTGALTGPQLLRRLKDNVGKYSIQPVGRIQETHRFRSVPDFQTVASQQAIVNEVGQKLFNPTLDKIKDFAIDLTPGADPASSIVPPPSFTNFEQFFPYFYRQNPGVTVVLDPTTGTNRSVNLQKPKKRSLLAIPNDAPTVPTGPSPDLEPLETASTFLKQAVAHMQSILADRPIVTRRVAMNLIDWGSESLYKEATQYCGYSFRAGPWRDALIKWGIDPRADPAYRIYQTLTFQLLPKDKVAAAAAKLPNGRNQWIRSALAKKDDSLTAAPSPTAQSAASVPSHVFDGSFITTNGKTYQVLDLRHPLLARLAATPDVRTACDIDLWGWYHNGTMAKLRVLARDMISLMLLGEDPAAAETQAAYALLAEMPERINAETYDRCVFERGAVGKKVVELSMEIRNMAKSGAFMKKMRLDGGGGAAGAGWEGSSARDEYESPAQTPGPASTVGESRVGSVVPEGEDEDEDEDDVDGDEADAYADALADGGGDVDIDGEEANADADDDAEDRGTAMSSQ